MQQNLCAKYVTVKNSVFINQLPVYYIEHHLRDRLKQTFSKFIVGADNFNNGALQFNDGLAPSYNPFGRTLQYLAIKCVIQLLIQYLFQRN